LRNELAVRLGSLEALRERVAAREEGGATRGADSGRELARLDTAIALTESAVARADRVLEGVHGGLREREGELMALRAAADARRMDRALAGPVGDPTLWAAQVARARDLLRTTLPDAQEQVTQLEQSGLP